jgi:hypothetical protein
MSNLRDVSAWLENADTLCGYILREPTSGLHKMNLAAALSRGKRVLKAPTGKGRKADQMIAHLAETVDTVRRHIWGTQIPLKDQYLIALRSMIGQLQSEVAAVTAEIEETQNASGTPAFSLQTLSPHGPVDATSGSFARNE